jgi:hypothetical protein
MAQVPSATRETLSEVAGISMNSGSRTGSFVCVDGDIQNALLCGDDPQDVGSALPCDFCGARINYG